MFTTTIYFLSLLAQAQPPRAYDPYPEIYRDKDGYVVRYEVIEPMDSQMKYDFYADKKMSSQLLSLESDTKKAKDNYEYEDEKVIDALSKYYSAQINAVDVVLGFDRLARSALERAQRRRDEAWDRFVQKRDEADALRKAIETQNTEIESHAFMKSYGLVIRTDNEGNILEAYNGNFDKGYKFNPEGMACEIDSYCGCKVERGAKRIGCLNLTESIQTLSKDKRNERLMTFLGLASYPSDQSSLVEPIYFDQLKIHQQALEVIQHSKGLGELNDKVRLKQMKFANANPILLSSLFGTQEIENPSAPNHSTQPQTAEPVDLTK